jgi:hypothetical protein
MPSADVSPEKGKGWPVNARFGKLALQQPVMDGVSIQRNARQQAHGRDQANEQAQHEKALVPQSLGGYEDESQN